MRREVMFGSLFYLAVISLTFCPEVDASPRPLRKSEILALVAGEIIPDNVVIEIQADGLAFLPDDEFRALLTRAGADPKIIAALHTANAVSSSGNQSAAEKQLLEQLSRAGAQIKAKQFDDAVQTLATSLPNGVGKNELGFVAGIILLDQDRDAEAGQLYSQIAATDPDFPQVHTRLALTLYNTGDAEQALRQNKIELARNPKNPVAHSNAGLALRAMHNLNGAKAEIEAAIQSNPNYQPAYDNLAIVLSELHDDAGAGAAQKKSLALKPNNANAHYNLGVTYYAKGDYISAIREYREAKRLDPARLDVRQNLGASLLQVDPAAAVVEFRELLKIAPDFPVCRQCLASALAQVGNTEEAEKEYLIAIELDPAAPGPHDGLGHLREGQKDYDAALAEYRKAEQLDDSFVHAVGDSGRVLLLQKKYGDAAVELKRAEEMDPGNWEHHDDRGRAFEGAGDLNSAAAEYQEALTLAPKEISARLDLANVLEKKSDWPGALFNYRRAVLDEPPPKPGLNQPRYDSAHAYDAAEQRFAKHLADLRYAGKSAEATALAARVKSASDAPNTEDKFHLALQASKKAVEQRQFDGALTCAKAAVAIAEKIQPQDGRLAEALEQLGHVYGWQMQPKLAMENYNRELAAAQSVYGPKSPVVAEALQNLALVSLAQRDFAGAENFFNRMVELNTSLFGENSTPVADALRGLAHVYMVQRDFPKSETTLLRVQKIYETAYGPNNQMVALPLTVLCSVYDQWGKQDKSAECHARLATLAPK
jgi:tetratricopeptide (TPR) repeat protein